MAALLWLRATLLSLIAVLFSPMTPRSLLFDPDGAEACAATLHCTPGAVSAMGVQLASLMSGISNGASAGSIGMGAKTGCRIGIRALVLSACAADDVASVSAGAARAMHAAASESAAPS